MKCRCLFATLMLLASAAITGCYETISVKRKGWFAAGGPADKWVDPGSVTRRPEPKKSELEHVDPSVYKAETQVVSPILDAKGKWTVRLAFFNPNPKKGLSALHYANDFAALLRKKGHDAYVTDWISGSLVSVGSFDDEHDPELIRLWQEAYQDWEKLYGGKSPFRKTMEDFYGGKTVFGDQPWPVAVIDLQMKMKAAYQIPRTEAEKQQYKDYLENQKKRMRGLEAP